MYWCSSELRFNKVLNACSFTIIFTTLVITATSMVLFRYLDMLWTILCLDSFFVILSLIVQPDLPSRSQKEGRETDQFWELLGGKSKYTNQKVGREHESDPHLFSCILSKGNTIYCILRIY